MHTRLCGGAERRAAVLLGELLQRRRVDTTPPAGRGHSSDAAMAVAAVRCAAAHALRALFRAHAGLDGAPHRPPAPTRLICVPDTDDLRATHSLLDADANQEGHGISSFASQSLDTIGLQILEEAGEPDERRYAAAIMPVRKRGNLLLCTLLLGNTLVNGEPPPCLRKLMRLRGPACAPPADSTTALLLFHIMHALAQPRSARTSQVPSPVASAVEGGGCIGDVKRVLRWTPQRSADRHLHGRPHRRRAGGHHLYHAHRRPW